MLRFRPRRSLKSNGEHEMRIAIVGAGGVGAYVAALLDGRGHEIVLLDRGEHLRTLRDAGVLVRSRGRGELRASLPATNDPASVGTVDLVLYAVKTYDNPTAIPAMRPLIDPDTAIVTLQNGVGNVEQLAAEYGATAVLGGPMVGGGTRVAPGVIEHVLPPESEYIEVGALEPASRAWAESVRELLTPTGMRANVVDDVQTTLWKKLLAMASLASVGCLTRAITAEWRDHSATRDLYARLVHEAATVGRAEGLGIDEATIDTTLAAPDKLGPAHRTSMAADLERGARLEVEAIQGEVVRRARRHGIDVPAFETAYATLQFADSRAVAQAAPVGAQ
jgi:2-dehydropantoate 2-reductase